MKTNKIKLIAKTLSLRQKLILGGISAIIIPLFAAAVILYVNLSSSLTELAAEKLRHVSSDIAALVEITIKQESKLIALLSSDPDLVKAVSKKDYQRTGAILKHAYDPVGADYQTFFIVDEDGILRAEEKGRKDLARVTIGDRSYFHEAMAGKTVYVGPVISRYSGKPVVVIAGPVVSPEKKVAGVLGIALKIGFLMDKISSMKFGETGYAYIVDQTGLILVHPRKDWVLRHNILNEPGTQALGRYILKGEKGVVQYSLQGTRKIAGIAPIPLMGWRVIYTQNLQEITAPANSMLYLLAAIGIFFVLFAVTAIVFLSRRISDPLEKILETVKHVMIHAADIIVMIGLDKKILLANHAYEQVTGLSADELAGLPIVLNTPGGTTDEKIWQILETGKSWSGQIVFTGRDTRVTTINMMIMPVADEKRAVRNYLAIGRDITKELEMEAKLRQSQHMESLGVMAGGIAHDFNNILSGIFGYTEMALVTVGDAPLPGKYLREVLNAAERARGLVNQILTFSRQAKIELHPVAPKYIIKEALKLLRPSTPASIEIRSFLNSDAMVMAEPAQLHAVMMNLCKNAVYAMEGGNGMLEIHLKDMDVDEEFARLHPGLNPGPHILLSVSDTGCGMEPAVAEKIFEPFFTTKPKDKGTGLGLAAVHGIVKNMGGVISVYSEVGRGTVFNIVIPQIAGAASAVEQREMQSVTGGTEKILLVDDEAPIVGVMKDILSNLGYGVAAFTDSLQAMETFSGHPQEYDLIMTDHAMPHLTGLELAQKARDIRKDIPIILMSGYIYLPMENPAINALVDELMKKPASTKEIAAVIRRVLDAPTRNAAPLNEG